MNTKYIPIVSIIMLMKELVSHAELKPESAINLKYRNKREVFMKWDGAVWEFREIYNQKELKKPPRMIDSIDIFYILKLYDVGKVQYIVHDDKMYKNVSIPVC